MSWRETRVSVTAPLRFESHADDAKARVDDSHVRGHSRRPRLLRPVPLAVAGAAVLLAGGGAVAATLAGGSGAGPGAKGPASSGPTTAADQAPSEVLDLGRPTALAGPWSQRTKSGTIAGTARLGVTCTTACSVRVVSATGELKDTILPRWLDRAFSPAGAGSWVATIDEAIDGSNTPNPALCNQLRRVGAVSLTVVDRTVVVSGRTKADFAGSGSANCRLDAARFSFRGTAQ